MKVVQALTFDDEPPGSVFHGHRPIIWTDRHEAAAELVAAACHVTQIGLDYPQFGDVKPVVAAIQEKVASLNPARGKS